MNDAEVWESVKILVVIFTCGLVFLIVFSIFTSYIKGSSINTNQTLRPTLGIPTTSAVPTTIPTSVPTPVLISNVSLVIINSTGHPGWAPYTVRYSSIDVRLLVYKPADWTETELKKTDLNTYYNLNTSAMAQVMDKFVYIHSPDLNGFIRITGANSTGTWNCSSINIQGKQQISSDFLDRYVQEVESTVSVDYTISMKNVTKDKISYLLNGNPARQVMFTEQFSDHSIKSDAYVIAHKDKCYIETYYAMVGSTQYDASIASDIMRTFVTSP